MKSNKTLDMIVMILLVVGGINWGLAIWDINLVAMLQIGWLIKTVYALVGIAGILGLIKLFKK